MGWLFNRKKKTAMTADDPTQAEVNELKKEVHKVTSKANEDIQRMNDLLTANGVTFRIHIAAGGKH
jgi:hypothetical protein